METIEKIKSVVSDEEIARIRSLRVPDVLNEWGALQYGDRFVRGICPDNQPFTLIEYRNENGGTDVEEHSFFHLNDEYLVWLANHKAADGSIMTDDEAEKSMVGKSLGQISDESKANRRPITVECGKDIVENRGRMLTVRKLIEYLEKQNPDACIMAYESNSMGYIEQWPELPNPSIRTVKEDMESQRDWLLNQWFKDYSDKEKRCEEELAETYRYCKDDDIIIKF